jgi:hypothetical protein
MRTPPIQRSQHTLCMAASAHMQRQTAFHRMAMVIRQHGMIVRRVTVAGVLAASPAVTAEGFTCSDLSSVLTTWRAVRDWLGY